MTNQNFAANQQYWALLCAMDEELAPFLAAASQVEKLPCPFSNAAAYQGVIAGQPVLLIRCGIGLVASASAAAWALSQYPVANLISAGTAGGLSEQMNVCDVAIATHTTYSTPDATEFGYELGQVPGQPLDFYCSTKLLKIATAVTQGDESAKVGQIISGDSFVTAKNVAGFRSRYPQGVATDMESCSIAQVCRQADVPFISIRGISDLCGPKAGQDFHVGVDKAAAASANVVLAMISASSN